jgi:hypothetical protein
MTVRGKILEVIPKTIDVGEGRPGLQVVDKFLVQVYARPPIQKRFELEVPAYHELFVIDTRAPGNLWLVSDLLIGRVIKLRGDISSLGEVSNPSFFEFIDARLLSGLKVIAGIRSKRNTLASGGPWLGAARGWIKRKVRNGESVTWGSDDVLEHDFRVRDVEDVAKEATAASLYDIEALVMSALRLQRP